MSPLIDALRAAPRRPTAGLAALALAGAVLSGCGGGSSASDAAAGTTPSAASSSSAAAPSTGDAAGSSSSTETEALTATEADFRITLDEDNVKAGVYTITVKNDGSGTHDLVVELNGSEVATSDAVSPGDTTTFTVTLAPGKYVFYCSIGNHRAMGMEKTVTVS